ncbi:MAG: hemolysin family protein [Mycoplasmatota bacterium]|nr:hemolysin family protein [Mycoplasmatota bacterium]
MLLKIILLIILILINGVFSATEIAFLSVNKYKLNKEAKKGNKKATKIINLLNDSSTFLSAIQVAITLSGFLSSAFAAESFAGELASLINISYLSTGTITTILIVVITIILSYFTLVFGELLPKKLGIAHPDQIAFKMVDIIYAVIWFFKPFIAVLTFSTNILERLFKINKQEESTEDELKDTIIDSNLEELEKRLLLNVFEFNDTSIKDVMTPKNKVITINVNDTPEEMFSKVAKSKFTRFPIEKDGKILGIINIKDIILGRDKDFNVYRYLRKVEKLDSKTIIDDAFLLLNSNYEAMAIVKEKGEYIGIVTVEDIIEHILGSVVDEYDQNTESK